MLIFLSIIGVVAVILVTGRLRLAYKFNKEITALFSPSTLASPKIFHYADLADLPEPVQRYFKHVLPDGTPYINNARLTHSGQFRTGEGKDWMNISGEQYFTAATPGFIWKGTTKLFTARDMFIAGKGRLVVSLSSVFNIVDSKGEKIDQGELLRWLGESVWFPTNLLPGENLTWAAIDSLSAKLSFSYNGINIFYLVTFNEIGEITRLETQRYMGEDNLETWVGLLTDYKEINGVKVPTRIEGTWKLPTGDFSYARFQVTKLEYDKPEKF